MSNIRPEGTFDPEHGIKYLPDNFAQIYKDFLLNEGDLIIAMTDMATETKILGIPTLVKNLNGRKLLMNQRVGKLTKFSKDVYIPYIKYILSSPYVNHYYKSKGGGGMQINISKSDILSVKIPVPSVTVQKQIVKILDKKFEKLNKAKELKEEALSNTEKLLYKTLSEIFEDGKKGGWKEKELHEICEIARGGSPRPIKNYLTDSKEGINWIKISDATSSDKYIYKTKEKIKREGIYKTRLVKPGDFILTNSMSFGRPYIMKTHGAIHDGWLLLRPNKDITEEYLYYFLSSDDIYKQFKNLAGGAVVQNLNSQLVRNIKILIPPIIDQGKIVKRIDFLSDKIKKLKELQKSQLEDFERLEKAYLKEAFNGELI
jgi:type I restriction enzyme S subunit